MIIDIFIYLFITALISPIIAVLYKSVYGKIDKYFIIIIVSAIILSTIIYAVSY